MINADELEDDEKPKQVQNVQTSESDDDETPPSSKNVELEEVADYDQFNRHEYSLIDQNQNNHIHNVFFETKSSGDYSMEASDSKPERKMMGKIAQLETQVFAMSKKIKQLESEKQQDEKEIEKLVLFQHKDEGMDEIDQMNIQIGSENILTDGFNAIKSMFVQETPVEAKKEAEPKKEEPTRVNSTAIAEMKNLLSEAEKAPQKVEEKVSKPAQKPVEKPVEKPAEKKPVEDTEQHLVPENTVHI